MIVYLKSISESVYTGRQHGTVSTIYMMVDASDNPIRPSNYISKVLARRAATALGLILIEDLNEAQLKALWRWKWVHGKYWRGALSAFWLKDFNHADRELLQQLRNTLGPKWLATFKLPEEEDEKP